MLVQCDMPCDKVDRPSRETRFLRDSVIDGFRIAGALYAYRHKYTVREYNQGIVDHCPYCWDDVLRQSNNSRCPYCFGSGFDGGGYGPISVIRAHVGDNTRDYEEKHEVSGIREVQDMTIKLPFAPLFASGDVFAEIIAMENGRPTVLGRMFQISGEVSWKTVHGIVSNNRIDLTADLRNRIVSQEASVKLLLETDEKYLTSDEFWGVSHEHNPRMDEYQLPDLQEMLFETNRHAGGWTL